MNNPARTTAKSSSSTTQKRKYKERVWRRSMRASLKELRAVKEDIGALIRRGRRWVVWKKLIMLKKARAGTKGISNRKHKRMTEFKKKQFRKAKTAQQLMKAQVAKQREETIRMKGETAGIIQATEDIEAEMELLRMHTDEMIEISEAEENLIMEIINSA